MKEKPSLITEPVLYIHYLDLMLYRAFILLSHIVYYKFSCLPINAVFPAPRIMPGTQEIFTTNC